MEREKYGEIRQLLKCVSESGMAAKSDGDTILLNCLEAFKRIPPQVGSPRDLSAPLSAPKASLLPTSPFVVHDYDFYI